MTLDRYEHEPSMLDPATDSDYVVLHDVAEYARLIADSDVVQPDLRGSVGRVAAVILYGRALGMRPPIALRTINIIKGRPAISAEGMRGLVFKAGHDIKVDENTSSRCILRGRRRGDDTWTTVEWTSADAARAGLAANNQWKNYPRAMLFARATAELCRMIFADVVTGLVAAEEADDYTAGEDKTGESVAPAAAPRAPVRRATKKTADPVPDTTPPETGPEKPTQGEPDAAPPAPTRQRPTIKPRGHTTTEPPAEPQATTSTDPAEPIDWKAEATARSEPDRIDTEPQPFIPAGRATDGQITAIVMHLERLGVTDRGQRITTTTELVGRRIKSTKDLDDAEAAKLIDRLSHLRNAEALEQAIKDQT